ncbi:MAG: hypothetical protein ACLTSG_13465 [Lachnospiraceae bacterium]
MYSAIKQGGKKLYEIAARRRARSSAGREPSRYTGLECTGERGRRLRARGRVLEGAPISRTLCDDIGRALGLRGLHVRPAPHPRGRFPGGGRPRSEEIEQLGRRADCLLPVDAMFAGRPIVLIKDERTEKALRNGADVKLDAPFEGEC